MTREEELKELQELEELAQLEALAAQEQAQKEVQFQQDARLQASIELNDEAPMPSVESAEKLQAYGDGIMSGIPFAKDIYSGGAAVKEAITNPDVDFSIDTISKSYHKNMADVNKMLRESEEKYPGAFSAGEITSGAAIMTAVPAAGATLAGVGILGAMYGLSKSEERTVYDAASGAASAIVFDRLGAFSSKMMGKMLSKTAQLADDTLQTAVGAVNKTTVKKLNTHLMRSGQTAQSFADNIMSLEVVGTDRASGVLKREPLISFGQTAEDTLEKAQILKREVGESMGTILSSLDQLHGKDAVLKPQDMHTRLRTDLVDGLINSDNPDSQVLGAKLSTYIRDMFKYPEEKVVLENGVETVETVWKWKDDFSLQKTHQLAKDISEFVQREYGKIPGAGTEASLLAQKKNVDGIVRNMLDEKISSFFSIPGVTEGKSDQVLNIFQQSKLDYGNLSLVEDLMVDQLATKQEGALGVLKNLFNTKGLIIAGGVAGVAMGKGMDVGTSIAMGATINQFLASSRTPPAMAVGLRKLADGLSKMPDPEIVQKLAVSTSLGMDDFRDAISFGIAKLEINAYPIKRSFAEIERRQDVLYQLIRAEDKQLAEDFATVMDTKEPSVIGEFLESIENHPKARKYIEPGVGYDGRVFSEQAKQMQIKNIDRANLPLGQALRLKDQVRTQGLIPDLTPKPTQPSQWNKRDKNKPRY